MHARLTTVSLAALALLVMPAATYAQSHAPALNWGPAPAVFPAGAKMAVLQGDTLDATRATVLKTGEFGFVEANMHHYAIARGRTVVQAHAVGPFVLTYVRAEDDPRNARGSGDASY